MMSKLGNLIILDLYRENWSVGITVCEHCGATRARMWPTGHKQVWCSECFAWSGLDIIPDGLFEE